MKGFLQSRQVENGSQGIVKVIDLMATRNEYTGQGVMSHLVQQHFLETDVSLVNADNDTAVNMLLRNKYRPLFSIHLKSLLKNEKRVTKMARIKSGPGRIISLQEF
jgi:hypothetical protein